MSIEHLDYAAIKLIFDQPLHRDSQISEMRGSVATQFKDNELFHQHMPDNQLVYRYPFIQYHILDGNALLVGIGPGAGALAGLNLLDHLLMIGHREYLVREQQMSLTKRPYGSSDELLEYQFISPWLGLNARNYQAYMRAGITEKRRRLLERILIGNVISMSKGLGYDIKKRLAVRIKTLEEVPVTLKQVPMLAFEGRFAINFLIPDWLGLGKSVSRGFGTVLRSY